MKNIYTLCIALFCSMVVFAQEKMPAETKIEKEVKMEEKNGEKVLTIITRTNNVEEVEVFKGEEAEAKLAEMEQETERLQEEAKNDPNKKVIVKKEIVETDEVKTKQKSKSKMSVQKEVSVEEKDGVKTVVVTTTKNGQVTSEVYRGEAAEKILQELEQEAAQKGKSKKVEVEIEEE